MGQGIAQWEWFGGVEGQERWGAERKEFGAERGERREESVGCGDDGAK